MALVPGITSDFYLYPREFRIVSEQFLDGAYFDPDIIRYFRGDLVPRGLDSYFNASIIPRSSAYSVGFSWIPVPLDQENLLDRYAKM